MFAEFRGAPLFLLCLVDILVSFILVHIPTFEIFFLQISKLKKNNSLSTIYKVNNMTAVASQTMCFSMHLFTYQHVWIAMKFAQ